MMKPRIENAASILQLLLCFPLLANCNGPNKPFGSTEKTIAAKPSVAKTTRSPVAAESQSTATYKLAMLDEDTARKLTLALADRECVLSTKPLFNEARMAVTYQTNQCCPNSIKGAMAVVDPKITLEKVVRADSKNAVVDHGSCGGCPYKTSCGGAR